jgi:NADH-quinone oxidoreductase subunit J
MGNVLVWAIWIVAASACLGSAVAVISFSNPFFSALALIGNLASLAALYLLLSAEFVAAAQVLVYAGAVMVMFLFVIAYVGGRADAPLAAGVILANIAIAIGLTTSGRLDDEPDVAGGFGGPAEVGSVFLTNHLLAFEITSIVLLVAAVGGVILGSERLRR